MQVRRTLAAFRSLENARRKYLSCGWLIASGSPVCLLVGHETGRERSPRQRWCQHHASEVRPGRARHGPAEPTEALISITIEITDTVAEVRGGGPRPSAAK